MNKTTSGLAKIVLSSSDPEAVSTFYARTGGVAFEHVEGTRRYESIEHDGPTLVIDLARDPLPQGRRECALSLYVPDLDAATARLREDGIEIGTIVERAGARIASLKDPDGRDVELWEPRSAAREAPPLPEKPALVEEMPALVAPPPVVEKPAAVEPPPLIEKPAAVEPPPLVEKPAAIEPPPLVEKPAAVEPPPLVEKPASVAASEASPGESRAAGEAEAEAPKEEERRPEVVAPPPMMGAPGPILSAARPIVASIHGGTKISLYGANFAEGARILVGDNDATSPRWVDDSLIEIKAPARRAGAAEIIIENPDGKRAALPITFSEGPAIKQFSPLEGAPDGGTEVTVEGRNLQEGCVVTFFGNHAPKVVFISPEHIRFTTPAHDNVFHGEVRVTNPDGLSTVADELFTYRLATPAVHAMSPATGLVGGGKRIAVKGVDFHPKCIARLGGSAASVTWKSADTLELITPRSAEPGPAELEIENPDGQVAKLEAAFTYEPAPTPPMLVEVQPDRGYCEGRQIIRLFGDNFKEDTVVRIGELHAVSRLISHRELEVELPPRKQPGSVAVELDDRRGVVVRREDAFLYEARPAPRVDEVSPRSGPMVGGTLIIIEGDFFDSHVYARIGGKSVKKLVVRSKNVIEVVSPPSRESGLVDVEVGRGDAGLAVVKKAFRYDPSPAPVIASIAPTKGGVDGGTEVGIEGKGFVAETTVLFGRTRAESVKIVSATAIEVKAPPGKNGEMVDITVRNPDGKEAVSKRAFMYDARYR